MSRLSPSFHTTPCIELCPHPPIPNHMWFLELAELSLPFMLAIPLSGLCPLRHGPSCPMASTN